MTRGLVRGLVVTGLGAACALLASEVALRYFVVGWHWPLGVFLFSSLDTSPFIYFQF